MIGNARPVVFAGPSIFGLDETSFAGLEWRPPAARGAILAALAGGAPAIGLIDGVYEHEPAIWHKEILYALSLGVPVLGAASMGALRAAECAAFGVVGIGGIFAEYHTGARTADADVAVLHAPAELGHQPLTVALVDAEATLAALLADGAVARQGHDRLLARARQLHFTQRTWAAICDDPGLRARAESWPSRKTEDARALLEMLRTGQFSAPAPFELNATGYLTGLARELGIRLERP
jgi:hypothetical protein